MKQPKHFYKSSPIPSEHKIIVPVPTLTQVVKKHPIRIPTRVMFGVGIASLTLISTLNLIPKIVRSWQPALLITQKPETTTTILEQKGATGVSNGLQFDARTADARTEIVTNFLSHYNSPLKPAERYARILVDTADRYNLDYRLLPAIMMQESNLCKTSDPKIHNCLGFGIHKRGTLAFDTYEESFDRAARELKERYVDQGLITPEQIMTKYTPSSNGSWANSVNQWIAEMEYNSREKGLESTQDYDLTVYSKK